MIKKKFCLMIFLFVFLIVPISAICEENQIDINSASLEELDELYGIGPVKAQAIIDARPFESIDNLIRVYGIGNITLNNIKEQGLACVDEEPKDTEPEDDEEIFEEEQNDSQEEFMPEFDSTELPESETKNIKKEVIKLNAQSIKRENDKENLSKNYAIYGFVIFCVVLCFLFIIRKNRFNKNEFE